MRSLILVVLALLAACRADKKETPETVETKLERPPAIDPNYPPCVTRACLEEREGERVQIEGTFQAAKFGAFAVNKLLLNDETAVVLPSARSVSELVRDVDGKKMKVRGKIFLKNIPDKYQILGRTPDPYLLDITGVDIQ